MRAAAIAFLLFACSSPSAPADLNPVFVVMCADVDPEQPHYPCCTGFALGAQVVTASHCVPGDTAELVSNRQWLDTASGSQVGSVTARDESRDIAWLTARLDGPGLTQGGAVAQDDPVRALTRSGVRAGTVGGQYGAFWQSSINTALGDSGAAVVNATGSAVGVISRCLTADSKQCDPNSAIFAGLQ